MKYKVAPRRRGKYFNRKAVSLFLSTGTHPLKNKVVDKSLNQRSEFYFVFFCRVREEREKKNGSEITKPENRKHGGKGKCVKQDDKRNNSNRRRERSRDKTV